MDLDKVSEIPMASPQLEDGYLQIANELFEAILKFPFSKRQLCVVLAIIRKTYGFNKKSDYISLSQLEKLTGIDRCHCSKTVKELVHMGVILKELTGGPAQSIALQKNYKSWVVLPKRQQLPKQQQLSIWQQGVTNSATKSVTETATTKDNIKNNIQKTNARKQSSPPCPYKKIINLFNEALPELEPFPESLCNGQFKKHLACRWKENPKHQSLEFWEWFFGIVRTNSNWMGENDIDWKASLGWLVLPKNFGKVIQRGLDLQRRQNG